MKRLNYLLIGLAGLAMASCSQDDLQAPGQGDGNFNVTVQLPADLGTRAVDMNTGYTANDLYYAVYDAADGSLVMQNKTVFTEAAGGALKTQVGFNLANGKSYKISFFAAAPGAATNDPDQSKNFVYTFNAEDQTMNVNYGKMTSAGTEQNDTYDCFINVLDTDVIGSNQTNTSIILYRPIAQINWGTSDLDEPSIQKAYGVNGQYILSNLSTNAYNTWNLLENDVTGNTVKVEYAEDFAQPQSANGLATFPVNSSVYKYVAMQYVLAPRQSEAIYDLNLNITNGGTGNPDQTELTSDVQVSSAPVQANYQTNIYGALLTDNVVVNVEKSPGWYTPSKDFVLIDGVEFTVITAANAATVKNGGNLILGSDIVYPSANTYIPLTKSSNINLNGFSLTSQGYKPATGTQTGDAIVVGSGANVKISNGTLLPATVNALADGSSATINLMTATGGSLTLDNVNVIGDMYPVMMTSSNPSANITINSGSFTFTDKWTSSDIVDKQVCVYISGAGTATINGGTFGMPGVHSEYLLNVRDDLRAGRQPNQIITVYGGTFINFDPSNNKAEGVGTNFLAPGYKVISEQKGADTYYTVVPNSTIAAATAAEVNEAAQNGGNVIFTGDITPESFDQAVYVGYTSISQNGGTINGNGNTLNVGSYYANGKESYGIYTSGGIIRNLTVKNAFRAILVASPMKENLLIEDCNLSGAYALNTSGSSSPYTLTVNNTVFTGWTSWNALSSASFTNCSFNIGNAFTGSNVYFNKVFRPYVETTFSNCTFQEGMVAGLSELPEGVKVVFNRCKVGNTYLTAANASTLFSEIELPEGKTITDVAVFN